MAEIRSIEEISKKWATVTPQRAADYEFGVRNPRKDWAAATRGAAEAWKSGVQAAISEGRFEKGVAKAGTGKWLAGSTEKGVQRWGPGVALAEDAYASGFAPYADAIRRTTLPPRYGRRDPRNLLRVNAIVQAMVQQAAKGG